MNRILTLYTRMRFLAYYMSDYLHPGTIIIICFFDRIFLQMKFSLTQTLTNSYFSDKAKIVYLSGLSFDKSGR